MGPILTTEELAERWGMAPGTLEGWRHDGYGPAWIKLGRGKRSKVIYRVSDVEAFESKSTKQPRRSS